MTLSELLKKVPVTRTKSNRASYYNPETEEIVISDGWIARFVRKLLGRSDDWIVAHEFAHYFLDHCSRKKFKELEKVFGSFSEDAYCSSALKELKATLFPSRQDSLFITPRATLCPEEDFAETVAFAHCHGMIAIPSRASRIKIEAVRRIVLE